MYSHYKELALAASMMAIALPAMGQGNSKKKPPVLEHLLNATYVYVEAYDGNEYDPRLLPEDRQAIADVEIAIEKWGRYHLTMRRSEAEFVIQVRKGRLASAQVRAGGSIGSVPNGVEFPPGSRAATSTHVGAGGEVGPPDDLFWVYQVDTKGELSGPYWRMMKKDGLKTPDLELFKKFKEDVEAAAAAQAKKKAAANPAGAAAPAPVSPATPTPPATAPPHP
jgi:hypothetical protein